MIREGSLEEISDGRLYTANDLVRADCQGCSGCSECCRGMGDSVRLDPMDMDRLCKGLGKSMDELLEEGLITLSLQEGVILPSLSMKGEEERCVFLNEEGRCSIHPLRPGFCRMFPLGRYYEEDRFYYILQIHECPAKNRTKIKVKKWLDTPRLPEYERFVQEWHDLLRELSGLMKGITSEELRRNLSLYVLNSFFRKPYGAETDFYVQFRERLAECQNVIKS